MVAHTKSNHLSLTHPRAKPARRVMSFAWEREGKLYFVLRPIETKKKVLANGHPCPHAYKSLASFSFFSFFLLDPKSPKAKDIETKPTTIAKTPLPNDEYTPWETWREGVSPWSQHQPHVLTWTGPGSPHISWPVRRLLLGRTTRSSLATNRQRGHSASRSPGTALVSPPESVLAASPSLHGRHCPRRVDWPTGAM